MEMNNTLLLAVGPVVAAAITVGGIWLKEALQRRGVDEERRRRMDQAKAQIEIVEAWARARASLTASTDLAESARVQAQESLDAAYDRAAQSIHEPRRRITLKLVISRLFLRQFHITGPMRLVRLFYYASFALPVLGAIGLLDQAQWSASGSVIGANIVGYFTVCVLPTWVLGWITSALARRRRGDPDSPAELGADLPGGLRTARDTVQLDQYAEVRPSGR
jgi:hypothetical protein